LRSLKFAVSRRGFFSTKFNRLPYQAMADAVAGAVSVSMKAVGTSTTVDNNPIAKLMYYLSCVNSCLVKNGQKLLDQRHTAYWEYTKLSPDEQALIVLLAALLSPDELIDVCFFVVPKDSSCLGGSANEFLEITKATTVLGAARVSQNKVALFKGEEVKSTKLMVCTESWIKSYFVDPFTSEAHRLHALQHQSKNPPCKYAEKCDHFERLNNPHCQEYTHPCPYQQSCWSRTDPEHLKFYTHDKNLPKCTSLICFSLKDPTHRAKYHHSGRRDYMIKCRNGPNCSEKGNNEHSHKYSH